MPYRAANENCFLPLIRTHEIQARCYLSLINLFVANAPSLCPLKSSENLTFFRMFSGARERVHWEQMG